MVYPRHFEVRFAEHICQLLKAVLHNLDASRNVWAAISEKNSGKSGKTDPQQASGFCKKWRKGSRQVIKLYLCVNYDEHTCVYFVDTK